MPVLIMHDIALFPSFWISIPIDGRSAWNVSPSGGLPAARMDFHPQKVYDGG
ncbi:hypothetical protein B8V81_0784 [Paenibacillus pasadenensis]|uniref:Uncharacterized protein n=1 Tax=Paenibacillus pasadenensis TaxID=217090 RepID=A0A2N5N8E0_9BACL|nr:hypothetical protein B8V81_0784 [Paenibacillus pasadenensis]